MRTTVDIPDQTLEELMATVGTTSRNEAVNTAIDAYLLMQNQQSLLAMRGRVAVMSNDEIEALDANEHRGP